MIIDCHGHFTTTPPQVAEFRLQQIAEYNRTGRTPNLVPPDVSDDEIRAGISANQLRKMQERGVDLTIFSPRAIGMDHHYGNEDTNVQWARYNNDLVHRVCQLYPDHFTGVCQLPQTSGVAPGPRVIEELERCILELGFIGANLNPDPSGGRWTDPPLSDRKWWYPLYEKLVELDVPAMIHVSGSCNPHFDPVAAHYINGDTTAFVQLMMSDVFTDFTSLKFIIPHGGGAAPYHWGRYRGMAIDMKLGELNDRVMKNIYFDTCVYHQPGIDLLLKVIPSENVLFASETIGAVRSVNPETGIHFDNTHEYIKASMAVNDEAKQKVYSANAIGVYKRLGSHPAVTGR